MGGKKVDEIMKEVERSKKCNDGKGWKERWERRKWIKIIICNKSGKEVSGWE